jgi:hypothetical protein
MPAVRYPLLLVVGALAFGLPTLLSARRRGSGLASAEAIVWAIGFVIAAVTLTAALTTASDLASPGDVNAVTTADMQRRNEYFRTWHYPRAAVLVVEVGGGFAFACGFITGVLSQPSRNGVARLASSAAFGIVTVVAIFLGLLLFVLGGPFFAQILSWAPALLGWRVFGFALGFALSGFAAGCCMGAIVESGRRFLLTNGTNGAVGASVV